MYIIDRRLNPKARASATASASCAAPRRWCSGPCARIRGDRGHHATSTRGGEVSIPADGVREPQLPALRRRRRARSRPARQQGIRRRRHASERPPRRRRRRLGGGADGEGEDDFRFVLSREEFLDLFLEDLELPDLVKRRLDDGRDARPAAGRLFGRPARRPTSSLPRTMRNAPVAPHRAAAAEARASCSALEEEIARLERQAAPMPSGSPRCARSSSGCSAAAARIPYIDPIDLRYSRFEPRAAADRAGGHVLPDGRVGLDDRAHEGPRQALLHAALHLPDAALPARRDRLHPPHRTRRRRSTRRPSSTAPRPAARWSRPRWRRCSGSSTERYPPADWNIYAAQASDGDNSPQRQTHLRGAAARRDPAVCQYFAYLEVGARGRDARIGLHRRTRRSSGRPTRRCSEQGADFAMRKVSHRREIYPGLPRAVPAARRGRRSEGAP